LTSNQQSPAAGWRNRRIPLLILGAFVLVIVISTLLYRASVLGQVDLPAMLGTKNNGTLITPPRQIDDLPLQSANGESFRYSALPAQWSMLIPVRQPCDEACRQTLYMTRQIHTALGKESSRVRRFVVTANYPLDAEFERILQEHPKLQVLKAESAALAQFFAQVGGAQALPDNAYFIVDPQGWVMMYYTPAHDGRAVLDDLKFLLKNSHEQEAGN
jgi:cytochrome oxidase Cu insertion factor (SCO1/SenC/PrrC family)